MCVYGFHRIYNFMNFFHFFSQNISCYAIEGIPFPNSFSLLFIFKTSFLFIRCYGCTLPKNPPKGRWDCDVLKNGNTVCMLQCEVSSNTMETELRMNKLKTPVPIIAGLCVYLYCKIYHTTKVPVCCWSPSPCSGAQIPASCVVVCDWLIPQ